MSWATSLSAASALALSTIQLFAHLLYVLSAPLRWCLQYVYASIVFLLSPIFAMLGLVVGIASYSIHLITRLKYLYIYLAWAVIIGICAGCLLHGTSSLIFVLLGIDTTSERHKLRNQQYQKLPYTSHSSVEDDDDDNDDDDKESYEESSSSTSRRRFGRRQHITKIDPNDLFEKRWKVLRDPEQPRRRRKGLLAQTIHEESSGSDLR